MTLTINVDANFVRQQLKKYNLTTNFLAVLGGFADRGMIITTCAREGFL